MEFPVTRRFPSLDLLPTPPSLSPLLPTPTVVICFGHQPLLPLLPTQSPFLLWHMLSTKSKFSIDLIMIADQYPINESALSYASSFASCVHEQPMKISDKIAQNNDNHGIQANDRNRLNTSMLVMLIKSYMLVVLIHFKS